MDDARALIESAYRDFNARSIDAVLARMKPDVIWPNGMEGGMVHGRAEVRDYWTRQWAVLDPKVEPLSIVEQKDGSWRVEVHQVVRDKNGTLLQDRNVTHVYRLTDGLIARMDIQEDGTGSDRQPWSSHG